MLFTTLLLFALLVGCWIWGDQKLVTKLIFTVLALAPFGLCFIPSEKIAWPALVMSAQAILAIIIGGSMFGMEWLKRRR